MLVSGLLLWSQLLAAGCSGHLLPTRLPGRSPPPSHPRPAPSHLLEPRPLHHRPRHRQHLPGSLGEVPSPLPASRPHQEPGGRTSLHLLPPPPPEVQQENAAVSARHLVTVDLALDVRRLDVRLLRWFQEGVAAALGVPATHVHIARLNEERNAVQLFVSSDRPDAAEPRPADEVVRALNARVLHRQLWRFGVTEVSTQRNVLQGQQGGLLGRGHGFLTTLLFLTVFIIVSTCLMVLFRMKEKVQVSERPLKAPPPDCHQRPHIPVSPAPRLKSTKVGPPLPPASVCGAAVPERPFVQERTPGSMVQADLPPAAATPTLLPQPIAACRRLAPPPSPLLSPAPTTNPTHRAIVAPVTVTNQPKSCPSPFRMKPAAGLQERRGSNVSLVLDMSALGAVEPLSVAVATPRDVAARDYLLAARRPLTPQQLRDAVTNTLQLHAEFAEVPMNFTDPKDLDVPNLGTKNRYKTILPNPHSRVTLRLKSGDPLGSYINANYIRGYRDDEKAFIATQGPMVNTVNDFWQMAWQEEAPVIVMITKLKEKNEKCVLYWPEQRGVYGRVEVVVSSTREEEHYTARSLTLKCGAQTRPLQHYCYTSWPDHKTPDSALPLLQLMADVEADRRAAAGPVIVHCSAGIGRTGCFIATTIGCRQLRAEAAVDVLSITCRLRADRGGMIQTGEQYEFVHHALALYEARLSAETGQ